LLAGGSNAIVALELKIQSRILAEAGNMNQKAAIGIRGRSHARSEIRSLHVEYFAGAMTASPGGCNGPLRESLPGRQPATVR
jgi:hypothetical protein